MNDQTLELQDENIRIDEPNTINNKQTGTPPEADQKKKEETLLIYDRPIFRAKKYEMF